MSTRLPPELAGELYLKANIEPMIYSAMNPQIAIELLDRAWQMIVQNQISFSYNYIDKPKEGSGYFLKVLPDEIIMPHDGYQYMDDEVTYAYPPDNRLSITERSQGFSHGDQYTHIVRRKYTLVQPGRETLAFLHYTRDMLRSVVVDGRRAKTPARQYPLKPIPGTNVPPTPTQLPTYPGGFRGQPPQKMPNYAPPVGVPPSSPQQPGQFGRFNAVPGPVPGPPGQQPPQRLASVNQGAYGSQRHDKKSSHKKHHQQPQLTPQQQAQVLAQQQAQAQEDAEEPSGDELDFLTARDVAIARYRRNHDYIAEVFSPYSIARITPPRPEYEKSIEFLRTLNSRSEFDVDAVKLEHDEKIKRFKAEAGVFYKGLEELKQATTVKEVFAANGRVESFKGMTVQPYTVLRQVELPKDETILTPELKPSRFPKPTTDPNATMAIATDGDESVSHDTTSINMETTANGVTTDSVPPIEQAGNSDAGVSEPFSVNEAAGQESDMAPTATATATASESMEVEVGSSTTAQLARVPLASEDTEMMDDAVSNEPQAGEQQGVIATESGYTAPLEATVAQEVQPTVTSALDPQQQAGFADVVMTEEQQDPLNQPTDQTHLTMETAPIVTSAPVTSSQVTLAEESSTVEALPESSTPQPMTTSSFDEQAQVAVFASGLEDQVGISEMDVQESFTSSVMEGDHTTTTTTMTMTSQIETTTMDGSGTSMVETTQSEGTVLHFADGHQEQFVQETVYQLVGNGNGNGNGNGPLERVESISESSGSGSTVAMTPMSELEALVPTSVPEAGFSSSHDLMASVDSFSIAPAEAFTPDLAFEALSTPAEAPAAEIPAAEAPVDVAADVLATHEDAPLDAPADTHPAEVPEEMPAEAPADMAVEVIAEGLTGAPEPAPAPAPAPVSAPGPGDGFSA